MPEVLRFDAVTKTYGGVVAVDSLSFSLQRDRFVVMLGPSGCGKTTTLRLAAGFEQPQSGRIAIDGRLMEGVPPHHRPGNTVFQDFALFPHMSVFDNVAFGPKLQGVSRSEISTRVGEMLELVHLSGKEQRRPHQLSGGQQQRVALARALINRPAILLLDEPLSNLDYKLRKEMRVELKRIRREVGSTFVFVTHDQEEALALADDIVVMSAGKLQQIGTPSEMYRSPASVFVASFIGATNRIRGRIAGHSGTHTRIFCEGSTETVLVPRLEHPAGTEVTLCIRVESISISTDPPDDLLNGLEGTIEEILYLGEYSEVLVRRPDGERVQGKQVHRPVAPALRVGAKVFAVWDPGETFAFPRE